MKEYTILVPVKASEELPKELGCFYTYTPGRPLIKRFEPDRPEDWNDVEIWYKETTKSELLKQELEKAIPSDDLKQYMTNLLYYSHDTANFSSTDFDKWAEESINGIDEYFKSLSKH